MALDDTIAILERAPLFGLLERDALRLLAFSAETRRLRAEEVLFRQGERSDGGYVVLSGAIAVSREGSADVAIAGPSALVGRLALFLRNQRAGTATARERARLIRVSPTLMRRVLEEFPSAAVSIRDALADDLVDLSGDLQRVRRMVEAIKPG